MHGTCGLNNPWHPTCGQCHNRVGNPVRHLKENNILPGPLLSIKSKVGGEKASYDVNTLSATVMPPSNSAELEKSDSWRSSPLVGYPFSMGLP